MNLRKKLVFIILLSVVVLVQGQQKTENTEKVGGVVVDYEKPTQYIIGGIDVTGIKYLGKDQILSITGLRVGDEITVPSEQISSVVKRIWMQRYFADVALYVDSLSARKDTAYFVLALQERPRVSRWAFKGIKNSEQTDLMENLSLRRGTELSEYVIRQSSNIIKDYYKEKGFFNADVKIIQVKDTLVKNAVRVTFDVDRGLKVKIGTITFKGNYNVKEGKLVSSMAKTRDRRIRNILKSKKFNEDEYENDKISLISAFNELGYRDARVVKDSIYYLEEGRMAIDIEIDEGKKYYFRDISWTGNSLYTEQELKNILRIEKGEVYDIVTLDKRLQGDPKKQDMDVASLYRNKGYLFFNIMPIETNIQGDSIDVEIRMIEGKPATFNNVIISGNTITNEKIVRRQIFTKPGYLYSQTDLERSIREIASMGHFDPEYASDPTRGFSIIPNQISNTVDVTYNVSEKPNSQVELSGGWGGYSFVGTLGLSFNNFSIKRLFEKGAWKPVPLGDAQVLSLRFQTNGQYYTAFSANFMEPWLTGKKPTSLNVSAYYTKQTNSSYYFQNNDEYMEVFGLATSIGSRLRWPDNYFVLYHELSWQTYRMKDWNYNFLFRDGISHNVSYKATLARNSTDQPVFPRQGSDFLISLQLTPPYSLFRDKDTDYAKWSDQDKYRWIEYHKWTFKGTIYTPIIGDLILMARAQFGYLGYYNKNLGYSPFEGFRVGGDGMSGYNMYGSEIIKLRGYDDYSLTPMAPDGTDMGHVYDKFTIELRYPIVLQPSSTIYALAFIEGGNAWADIRDFNPFSIKRSAGVGLRIMLPMIGLLGVDWAWGFDSEVGGTGPKGSKFHFVIGQEF